MSSTAKALTRKAFTTTPGDELYAGATSPAIAVATNMLIVNSTSSTQTVTVNFNNVPVISNATINANDTVAFDIKQVLDSGQKITGHASSALVYVHISGLEIT